MLTALADLLLLVHFAFVLFVVLGLPLTWIGAAAGWSWIRNRRFRIAHLAAIVFVAAESLIGMMCPLTVWEDALRGTHSDRGFVARWIHRLMYYELPEWVFAVAYLAFAALVAWTYRRIPPHRKHRRGGQAPRGRA